MFAVRSVTICLLPISSVKWCCWVPRLLLYEKWLHLTVAGMSSVSHFTISWNCHILSLFFRSGTDLTLLFIILLFLYVLIVIVCEDRLRNDLYCVRWGVKLYSVQSKSICVLIALNSSSAGLFRQWVVSFIKPAVHVAYDWRLYDWKTDAVLKCVWRLKQL